jgi:maltose alpha-D-glucosyltransferase/alpha-amylase
MVDNSIAEESFVAVLHGYLPGVLPEFLRHRRWFGGKARRIDAVEVSDVVPVHYRAFHAYLVLAQVSYDTGPADTYDIPLVRLGGGTSQIPSDKASVLTLRPEQMSEEIVLADALSDERFLNCLLDAIVQNAAFSGSGGELRAVSTNAMAALWQPEQGPLAPALMRAEQSNSSVVYGQCLVLKIFRRVERGINPDLEIGLFLTEHSSFRNVPTVAGHIEYLSKQGTRTSLGVLQGYVPNQGDAWEFTLRALTECYDKARQTGSLAASEIPQASLLSMAEQPIPERVSLRIGPYLESAALLGQRTAELHLALASAREYPAFEPQRMSEAEQKAFATSAMNLVTANFSLLRQYKLRQPKGDLLEPIQREADRVLSLESTALRRFQRFGERKLSAELTRIHGDYHLGQVLFTGSDFVLIDFEGEPARTLEERRKKRSPLQDVAGMLRSFHYAAYAPLLQQGRSDEELQFFGPWAYYWQKWVSAAFLRTYLEVSRNAPFVPQSREDLTLLLDAYILDKAVYELGYELNNRPSWVGIPLEGISQLLQDPG